MKLPASDRFGAAFASLRPREHGGWSMALEPVVLGLLVAPSWSGAALAGAILAVFLARRPLQIVTAATRPAGNAANPLARGALLCLAGAALLLVVVAARLAGPQSLWPLGLALPPAALFLWLDAQGEARATAAEIAGTVAFALLPAAFVSLQFGRPAIALALSVVLISHSLPAVLAIRAFLRRRKGQPVGITMPLLAALFAVGATAVLSDRQLAPWCAPGFAVVFLLRTLWFFGPRPPTLRATRLGILEATLGGTYVIAVGLTWPQR